MKKLSKILILLFLATFLAIGSASATVDSIWGTSLSNVFDTLGLSAQGYDVVGSQKNPIPYWNPSAVGSITSFRFSDVAFSGASEFGIFSAATAERLPLFTSSHGEGETTTMTFLGGGIVSAFGTGGYSATSGAGFGTTFGFYIQSDDTNSAGLYYSDPSMNPLWTPLWNPNDNKEYDEYMLFYQGGPGVAINPAYGFAGGFFGSDDWLIAGDGWFTQSYPQLDFNDVVIFMESVRPVPEPATMLLSGLGLLGIGVYLRRKFKKA